MAAVMSPHSCLSTHEDEPATIDMSHLSGMTLSNFAAATKEPHPKIHLIDASPPVSHSSASAMGNSKRSSMASVSTSKSQLRHTNHLLIGMLQNIQTELETHRSIMLDIQHRVSHLESESEAGRDDDMHLTALKALEGSKNASKHNSRLVPPEGVSWWKACQAFARNSEPPISAREFLRTPKRFSGFNFDWPLGPPTTDPTTPPATPPQIDELPPLTPTSDEGEGSDLDTPTRHDIFVGDEILTSTPKISTTIEVDDEIKGQEVEVDKKKMPMPPMLMPAPAGRSASMKEESVKDETEPPIEMIESEIAKDSQRYYKGVKSLSTYKALLRHKSTEKEHHVLIHFHRRADLAQFQDA